MLRIAFISFSLLLGINAFAQEKPKPVKTTAINLPCFFGEYEWVIRDQKTLDSLGVEADRNPRANCIDNNPIPKIDFKKYTLIGYGTNGSGCNPPDVQMKMHQYKHKLDVRVTVTMQGLCDGYFSGKKWYLIPRIPDDTPVTFKATRKFPGQE